jgi:hypothetical protein
VERVGRFLAGAGVRGVQDVAIEAVIEPLWPVVRSVRSVRSPAGVSCRWTLMVSPGLMSKSSDRFGFTAVKFGLERVPVNNGFAGAWDTPLLVT